MAIPQSSSSNQKYHFLGFTLLELIVVVAIILIFSGSLLAQYGGFSEQSELKQSAQQLSDVFSLAQKKAMSNDVLASCTDSFNGYRVLLSQNQFTLSYCCSVDCSFATLNTYSFPSNITFSSGPGSASTLPYPYPVQFKPSLGGTTLSTGIDLYITNSKISGTAKCIHMTLSNVGIISLNNQFINCP